MINALIFSLISGVIGTGLGGVIGALIGRKNSNTMIYVLSFACGIMISVVFFDLLPESNNLSNTYFSLFGLICGIIVILLLNFIIDKIADKNNITSTLSIRAKSLKNNSMLKAGWVMFFAIGIHNFPEGMAIGTSIEHNLTLGITLAIIMALHDIPEGISISLPLISGGMKKSKAILLTLLSGSVTILGAILGSFLGTLNNYSTAFALAFAGGAMLYVSFGEILPETILNNKENTPTLFCMIGIILGIIITSIF